MRLIGMQPSQEDMIANSLELLTTAFLRRNMRTTKYAAKGGREVLQRVAAHGMAVNTAVALQTFCGPA
jgi:hypothetical protein